MFRLGGRRQLQIKLRRTLVRLDQVPRSSLDYDVHYWMILTEMDQTGYHSPIYDVHQEEPGEESKPSTSLPSPREIHRELDNYVIAQAEAKKILSVAVFNHYIRIKALEKVEENRKRESSKKESESKLNPTQSQTPTSRSNFPPNMADDPEQNSSIGLSRPSSTTGIAHNLIMSKAVEASLRLEREELETRIRQISSRQFKKKRPSKPDLNSPDDYLQLLPFTPSYSSSISESPIDEPTDLHKPTIPASVPEGKTHHQELNRENPTQFSNNDDHQEFQNIEWSGKSLLARTLARQLDVPYIESSATTFTQAGYVGEDVESCVIRLYQESNNDASRASRGIIFIDEIDKIARKSGDGYVKDVSGEGVQQAMLRLLEGTLVTVSDKGGPTPPSPNPIDPIRNHLDPSHSNNSKNSHLPIQVDTTNILFILAGAFVGIEKIINKRISKTSIGFSAVFNPKKDDTSQPLSTSPEEEPKLTLLEPIDLNEYGLIPEFIGRIPILATLSNLTETDLHRILIEPKNSLLHQYINLFKSFNVKIHFSTKAQKAIASLAYRKNTGARGLRQILVRKGFVRVYVYCSQSSIRYILIDEPVILANSPAKFYSRGEEFSQTVDLPSDRKYVFGYHPHGIIGMGAVANFGTEDFNIKFRDMFSINKIMYLNPKIQNSRSSDLKNNKGEGNCLVIVVGGAAESLSAHPGTADLTLKRRLGFIKLAIREGADLVPVFSFGENDIYAQLSNSEGTALYTLQKRFQAVFGFTLHSLGLLPYRHPIVSVVGKPIRVIQNKNPTLEEIEKVQREYINELTAVWDKYKDLYARNRKSELTLIA
ncbi:hypothetical protein H4Q26_009212 [Puccinia striiformis f. sp. tritici PST-130]|nr:hypothetical protein H4Q26_009212 [Puccinia striiformis f. sp. tritici PST-130]